MVIDDFYGWIRLDEMLRILDRYPHRVEVKGGMVQFLAEKIYITSNVEPKDWYKDETHNVLIKALLRRIDNTIFMKETPYTGVM